MNKLINFNPGIRPNVFRTIFNDSFFNDSFFNDFSTDYSEIKTNVKEDEKSFNIDLSIPGIKKEDVKLNIENNILSISSKSERINDEKDEKFVRKEFSYSSFEKSYQLPDNVNTDNISAKHENGILSITIPKSQETNTKKTIYIE